MRLQLDVASIDGWDVHTADGSSYWALRSARRILTPRRSTSTRPRDHGVIDRSEFYDAQMIELVGYVNANDDTATEHQLDTLGYLLRVGAQHEFVFHRIGATGYEMMWFQSAEFDMPAEGYRRTAVWTASLLGADPRIYSTTVRTGNYDPTLAGSGSGIDFPADFPLVFAGGVPINGLIVENDGNVPTPAVLTVTGPVTNPIVDNLSSGESIYTQNCSLAAGDKLEFFAPIDPLGTYIPNSARRATLNGTSRPDLVDPRLTRWFHLKPGSNFLQLRGSGMATGQTNLAVTFRDARI